MVSDVLCEASDEIKRYLREFPEVYSGDLRKQIEDVVKRMDAIRIWLDTPPSRHADDKLQ